MKFKFEFLFLLCFETAFAALSAEVTLGTVLINQNTTLRVQGSTANPAQVGDCFLVAL